MDVGVSSPILTQDQKFDVLVIGGGINGVAIARECAQWNKRVLLVEQNDFSSGTTSRSTRIIHGGLRYLEHGEFALVRESLRERELDDGNSWSIYSYEDAQCEFPERLVAEWLVEAIEAGALVCNHTQLLEI